jgi:hypothetical protein
MNRSDRLYEFLVKRIFEQVTSCSCFECSKDLYIALVGRQHNDFRFGKFAPNGGDGIQAVHLRHLQVHERDVRPMRTELFQFELLVVRLANHLRRRKPAARNLYPVSFSLGIVVWQVPQGTPNLRAKFGMALASRTAITTWKVRNKATTLAIFVTNTSNKRANHTDRLVSSIFMLEWKPSLVTKLVPSLMTLDYAWARFSNLRNRSGVHADQARWHEGGR